MTNSEGNTLPAEDMRSYGGKRLKGIDAAGSTHQPLVSVVTAVYNGRLHLAGCIESVLCQDYPNIEHIIMDGGSNDGTVDILRQYDDRIGLWRSERDSGIYDAWNKALRETRGEWICFLGADDEFLPNAITAYMALAAENPGAEYLSSRIRVVHPSGYVKILGCAWTWKKFSRLMCTPHVGAMHRRTLFDRLGVYDTSYRIVADYELLLRAGHELKAAYMPDITAMMRAGGVGSSSMALAETARAKVVTGGRSKLLAAIELYIEKAIFPLRPPVRSVLQKLAAR
jgi:glycosyltransferase involved in cell wall biosynthesis